MSVCETCWTEACYDVMYRGGSTVDRYRERIAANEEMHVHPIDSIPMYAEASDE